ncbi:Uncharacterized [Moorella glycerini]|uniref:Uroporphyrinogen decarboxylase (URO-D) domain-containing protein n=1 Tax=Neomoorella stamsii TaxID=1266720 RepID=A0A9X7J5Z6_9FIRM|nr:MULTISPECIES: hypothetical protein [Moorella]PRR76357.1 hypothetical protein MOST_05240 [Moorella stamsii]CEP67074.1 Uncharacterized [Moorella glycerini]
MLTAEQKLELHHAYWNKQELPRPLIGYQVGSQLISENFIPARKLLESPQQVTPEMIVVEEYYDDYQRMYEDSLKIEQEAFWAAVPFPGIPWIEAILGCPIYSTDGSFWAKPCYDDINQIELYLDQRNPWLEKLLEFTEKLVEFSQHRFPVGQPILRGPADLLGALLGQEKMVYAFYDHPETVKRLAQDATRVFIEVVKLIRERIPPFYDGYSFGWYPLWAPDKCLIFQEDLMALGSPAIYRQFFYECDRMISKAYTFTTIHVHPNSFFIVEDLIAIKDLKVIEINYDLGGPPIKEIIPLLLRILEKKCLILRGILKETDLEVIKKELPCRGLFLHIVVPDLHRGEELNKFINELYQIDEINT